MASSLPQDLHSRQPASNFTTSIHAASCVARPLRMQRCMACPPPPPLQEASHGAFRTLSEPQLVTVNCWSELQLPRRWLPSRRVLRRINSHSPLTSRTVMWHAASVASTRWRSFESSPAAALPRHLPCGKHIMAAIKLFDAALWDARSIKASESLAAPTTPWLDT